MAAKKPESWRKALPKRVNELQRTAEKQMRKTWERAVELLPPAPRKAVKQLTARVERTRHDLRKRGDKVVADMRKRADKLTADVQKRIERAVTPMTRRLDVASRAEVDRLHKRLHELERRVEAHGRSAA
jgi:polyhydroxyalkanoate synthesis regulator phasin